MLLSRTVRLFLDSIGKREEYEYYLNRFQDHDAPFFALIYPDRETIELSGDLLAFHLQFLAELDLKTAVLSSRENAAELKTSFAAYEGTFVWSDQPQAERITLLDHSERSFADSLPDLIGTASKRLHFIRFSGAFHDAEGAPVAVHYTQRRNRHVLNPAEMEVAELSAKILTACPTAHISVCSPLSVLEELFTVKGHGTLIRRGSTILSLTEPAQVDFTRLCDLFQDGFGRRLDPEADFSKVNHFFIESNYRGAVLMEDHPAGHFLSKFVVSRQARGEGLAQELWEEACGEKSALFWRSRRENPINSWYDKQADGIQRGPKWYVYWRAVAPEHISDIILYCRSRPSDFVGS